MMSEERREHERKNLGGSLQLVGLSGSCGADVLDVSEGGLRVHALDAPGEWGDSVLLRRVGTTEDGVRCHIVRVLPDGVGVQVGLRFDRAEPDGHARLLALLS
ncbi:MAG: PilZ domain-containing protein [Myxococcaceae bacterium]|nr:PilZ domain-containing protein [Myxococcaceae bacterium]